jgi:hypothetical protein
VVLFSESEGESKMRVLQRLWADDAGAVVSAELVLVGSILVLGMIVGLATLRDHVVQELADIAGAIGEVQQTYSFSGISGHNSSTAGTDFTDLRDDCDEGTASAGNDGMAADGAQCVSVSIAATGEGPEA